DWCSPGTIFSAREGAADHGACPEHREKPGGGARGLGADRFATGEDRDRGSVVSLERFERAGLRPPVDKIGIRRLGAIAQPTLRFPEVDEALRLAVRERTEERRVHDAVDRPVRTDA